MGWTSQVSNFHSIVNFLYYANAEFHTCFFVSNSENIKSQTWNFYPYIFVEVLNSQKLKSVKVASHDGHYFLWFD